MPGRPKQPKQVSPDLGGVRDGAGRGTERNGYANVLITVRLTQEERDELMRRHALPSFRTSPQDHRRVIAGPMTSRHNRTLAAAPIHLTKQARSNVQIFIHPVKISLHKTSIPPQKTQKRETF